MVMKRGVLAEQEPDAADPNEPMEKEPGEPSPQPAVDERSKELFNLVHGRVREALAKLGRDLDAALKADPVMGAVKFGTLALRTVVMAAQKAGKQIPPQVILAAGIAIMKDIASIAVEKGYLQEQDLKGFMAQVFQQSVREYGQMDKDEGIIPEGGEPPAAPDPGVLSQASEGAM